MNDPEIEDLKARADIVAVIGETVQLKQHGNYFNGLCPFHPHTNNTPSFVVWPDIRSWKCYGACAESGDILKFIMRRDACDFKAAKETLSNYVFGRGYISAKPKTESQPKPQTYEPPSAEWQGAARLVVEHCHTNLIYSTRPLAWLDDRGLTADTIANANLGYHPRPAGASARQYGAELFGIWVPFGIIIPCVVGSNLWYLKVRTGLPDPKYLNAKGFKNGDGYERVLHPALFGADTLPSHANALFVEGELDQLLAEQECGDFVGVASLGAQGNKLNLSQWARYFIHLQRGLMAYDNDGKSEKGAAAVVALSNRFDRVTVPEGKDLTRYRQTNGRDALRRWVAGCLDIEAEWQTTVRWEGRTNYEVHTEARLSGGEKVLLKMESFDEEKDEQDPSAKNNDGRVVETY